jgi:hypothetical protein
VRRNRRGEAAGGDTVTARILPFRRPPSALAGLTASIVVAAAMQWLLWLRLMGAGR